MTRAVPIKSKSSVARAESLTGVRKGKNSKRLKETAAPKQKTARSMIQRDAMWKPILEGKVHILNKRVKGLNALNRKLGTAMRKLLEVMGSPNEGNDLETSMATSQNI